MFLRNNLTLLSSHTNFPNNWWLLSSIDEQIGGDDFDDNCDPYANFTSQEACNYVINNTALCEAGGYLQWTNIVICALNSAEQTFFIILSLLWLLQLFVLLATSADAFLAQNIATITQKLNISESLAGVTLVAFSNGAPDIFSAIAAAASDDRPNAGLAFGQLLGGAMFVTTIVVPTIIILKPVRVEAGKTLRILGFYLLALGWLTIILFAANPMQIWQPLGFLVIYLFYALTIVSSEVMFKMKKWRESKKLVFVKPANNTPNTKVVSSISSTLERSNSVKPIEQVEEIQVSRILDNSLPCQDTNYSALLIDFKKHVISFDLDDFKKSSIYSQVFQILRLPCEIALSLTIPLGSTSWCKLLALVHLYTSPIALIFAFQFHETVLFTGSPKIWVYSLIISTLLACVLMSITSFTKEPKYYRTIACFVGFVLSIGWVYGVCAEVVDVVQMLGIISHLSPEILGVTILGWTNSIGDLVADIALTKQGYSQMAFSAGFGGPLFNLLMGFGLAFSIAMLQGKKVQIEPDQQKYLMFGFIWASIISSLILLIIQRFYARKPYAIYLYCIYLAFIVALVLSESDLLTFF